MRILWILFYAQSRQNTHSKRRLGWLFYAPAAPYLGIPAVQAPRAGDGRYKDRRSGWCPPRNRTVANRPRTEPPIVLTSYGESEIVRATPCRFRAVCRTRPTALTPYCPRPLGSARRTSCSTCRRSCAMRSAATYCAGPVRPGARRFSARSVVCGVESVRARSLRTMLTEIPAVGFGEPLASVSTKPAFLRARPQTSRVIAERRASRLARGIFTLVADLRRKILRSVRRYNTAAKPFRWSYADPTRRIA